MSRPTRQTGRRLTPVLGDLQTGCFWLAFLAAAWLSPLSAVPTNPPAAVSPVFQLSAGERYWRVGGTPAFVLGRNPVGFNPEAFEAHFTNAAAAGERFMRIHFTYSPPGEKPGEIHPDILKAWDAVLDSAERHRLAVLPVLGIWSDWNEGTRGETWHLWDKNPFNAALGGPATHPGELLDDTVCRRLWLQRVATFARRWAPRTAIVGWEIFSEVDLITGATEDRSIRFAAQAAAAIRAADPARRPVTISQAGTNAWPGLLRSEAVQIVQVHPYAASPFGGYLDQLILDTVRERLRTYGKPVLIGECGLDWAPPRGTLDVAPRAEVGIRHAIWAAVISGAMSGRMLWWQDGWDQFEKADICRHYEQAAVPVVRFVRDIDFSRFAPVACEAPGLTGGLIGNDRVLLGWFRDARCVPPDWPVRKVSDCRVTFAEGVRTWTVEFVDTRTGSVIGRANVPTEKSGAVVTLPPFEGSIALRLKASAETIDGSRSVPHSSTGLDVTPQTPDAGSTRAGTSSQSP